MRRLNDLYGGADSEAIKQSILDIDSVVQKIASLCENKHMQSIFKEVSHIAHVSTRRLGDRLSYLRQVSVLDQRLFKNRKDLCNFITEVPPACEGSDCILINKLINNIELVLSLLQQSVESLIQIHRKNNVFNIISEIKSMYRPFMKKKAPFALQRLKTKLSTLESSPTKVADNLTVGSGADSDKADSIIYSKAWGETKTPV